MFTWLNKQGIQSDEGFEFQITGRFTAEYREDSKAIEFYVENGGTPSLHVLTVYEGSLEPFVEAITNPFERRKRIREIVKNIDDSLKFMGSKLDFVEGSEPTL